MKSVCTCAPFNVFDLHFTERRTKKKRWENSPRFRVDSMENVEPRGKVNVPMNEHLRDFATI
ncbi:hypothetical protein WN55_04408 [Dufourea novaeangliae]|uniref:Uncharacterized protein n=1 Tax=Dufourea novaeangliae TaxID=178035 RepID=A0A154PLY6_DUFNO|nr:hypothetical protein WN55_04408 [Dufourea novaeangliae]